MIGAQRMRESLTRQAILEAAHAEVLAHARAAARAQGRAEGEAEGALIEARRMVLLLGSKLLGKPGEAIKKQIIGLSPLQTVERVFFRIPKVRTWQELMPNQLKQDRQKAGKANSNGRGRSSRRIE